MITFMSEQTPQQTKKGVVPRQQQPPLSVLLDGPRIGRGTPYEKDWLARGERDHAQYIRQVRRQDLRNKVRDIALDAAALLVAAGIGVSGAHAVTAEPSKAHTMASDAHPKNIEMGGLGATAIPEVVQQNAAATVRFSNGSSVPIYGVKVGVDTYVAPSAAVSLPAGGIDCSGIAVTSVALRQQGSALVYPHSIAGEAGIALLNGGEPARLADTPSAPVATTPLFPTESSAVFVGFPGDGNVVRPAALLGDTANLFAVMDAPTGGSGSMIQGKAQDLDNYGAPVFNAKGEVAATVKSSGLVDRDIIQRELRVDLDGGSSSIIALHLQQIAAPLMRDMTQGSGSSRLTNC
jgi:hypothetical protein